MENDVLVSVGIIAYNSSKYVSETLNSIKAQTYKNIELIISDDCSTDNTIEICKKWIESNKERFVRTEIITVPQNTGIPANFNRVIKTSQGEWIKTIAGDDLLLSNCIKDNIEYIKENDTVILFSKQKNFKCSNGQTIYLTESPGPKESHFFNMKAKNQFEMLLERNYIWIASTLFIKASFVKTNSFDERFPYIEDYPMWLKLTKNDIQLPLMDSFTTMYRCEESITRPIKLFYNIRYMESLRLLYYLEIKQHFLKQGSMIDKKWKKFFFRYDLCMFLFKNKKTFLNSLQRNIINYFIKKSTINY